MEKKNNYLNRKTLRKMKRQEKKQKKDFFYKHKINPSENKEDNENFNNKFSAHSKFNKMNLKFFNNNNKKETKEKLYDEEENIGDINDLDQENNFDTDDEEVDSDIPSDKDSEEENNDLQEDDEDEVNDEEGMIDQNKSKSINTKSSGGLRDLDIEIKTLEKRLGLKDDKRKERFRKKVADENYDEDLFEFLDNIETIVKQNKDSGYTEYGKTSVIKKEKVEIKDPKEKMKSTKLSELEKVIETKSKNQPKDSGKTSLVEIKSQSRLFSNLKINEEDQAKLNFQKEMTSLLNKISEANLILTFPDFISKIENFENSNILTRTKRVTIIYEVISKICIKMTLDPETTNLPITSCICSYISVLHYKFGNHFLLYFMKTVFDKINLIITENIAENSLNKSTLKNFIFVIIHFFILQNLTSKMYFEIIKVFIENFNATFSEMLLILLSYIGIEIRKEDPDSLKEIISSINKKYNIMKVDSNSNVGKIKYIVDMIDDIKNNKYMKFNLSEKFNFFKTFVNTNKSSYTQEDFDLSSNKIADRIDLSWDNLKSLDLSKIQDLIENNENIKPEKQIFLENSIAQDLDSGIFVDNSLLEKKMKKFKMTTDLKKMIFTAILSATDCNDAFERLMRLNLKRDQAREIIKIIVMLTTEEKSYNPFYRLLLIKLLSNEKDHKYTFHYTIWDYLKVLDGENFTIKKIHNLGKLCGELMSEDKISLPVFLNFEFEESGENAKNLLIISFDKYFEKTNNPDKCKILFAKLVKNDDHVEFAKRLFYFLTNDFKNKISLQDKNDQYMECYSAATRVLKRIL